MTLAADRGDSEPNSFRSNYLRDGTIEVKLRETSMGRDRGSGGIQIINSHSEVLGGTGQRATKLSEMHANDKRNVSDFIRNAPSSKLGRSSNYTNVTKKDIRK